MTQTHSLPSQKRSFQSDSFSSVRSHSPFPSLHPSTHRQPPPIHHQGTNRSDATPRECSEPIFPSPPDAPQTECSHSDDSPPTPTHPKGAPLSHTDCSSCPPLPLFGGRSFDSSTPPQTISDPSGCPPSEGGSPCPGWPWWC
jgi:hypothetical protein